MTDSYGSKVIGRLSVPIFLILELYPENTVLSSKSPRAGALGILIFMSVNVLGIRHDGVLVLIIRIASPTNFLIW